MSPAPRRVLVLGATGVVGNAAARRYLDDDDVEVLAVSRRVPDLPTSSRLRHLPVDLRDAAAVRSAVADAGPVTDVVYAALFEKPDLISGWTDREQIDTNRAMFANVLDALEASGAPRHVSVLQGTKAYGFHVTRMRVPAKESQPRVEHDNFYWEQEDLLMAAAARLGFGYTIFRPQFIFGAVLGVAMNLIPVIGAYAAIRRELGEPFSYPGGASYVAEAVDSRLLGRALHWASTAETARDQTFNITNGDVFEWRDLWPSFAEQLGVETGPDASLSLAEWFPRQDAAWRRVVERSGLRPTPLPDLIGFSHAYADNAFSYTPDGADLASRAHPVLLSTVKLRQAGFADCVDTAEMFGYWFGRLRADRVLP